ncbi:MAG: hypothetical protein D6717_12515 [Gammaproteobacteria bacterium]|nr:MAG: hypothetical protein D6717_12515 [Gammaproteobacteria bacterium]
MTYSLTALVFLAGAALMALGSLAVLYRAFRWRLVWGLFVLLVPVAGLLAFTVVHWQQARNGVLAIILGVLVMLAALWGGADRELGLDKALLESPVAERIPVDKEEVQALLEKRPGEVEVPNEEKARALGIDTEKSLEEIEAEEQAKPLPEVVPPPAATAPPASESAPAMAWQPVSRRRLEGYSGRPLRVYLLDGKRYEGLLERLSEEGDSVILRRRVAGGEVAYEYPFARIEWLEVWAPRGSVPPPEDERPAPGEVSPRFLPPGQKPEPEASSSATGASAAEQAQAAATETPPAPGTSAQGGAEPAVPEPTAADAPAPEAPASTDADTTHTSSSGSP